MRLFCQNALFRTCCCPHLGRSSGFEAAVRVGELARFRGARNGDRSYPNGGFEGQS